MPTVPLASSITTSTTLAIDTGVAVDEVEDGSTRQRSVFPTAQHEMQLSWTLLTPADYSTLRTFWLTNSTGVMDLSLHGESYSVRLISGLQVRYYPNSGNLRDLTVTVRGTLV